jgi:membrane protein
VKARVTDFVVAFNERGLLTYASAIAFQVISALAPALLFVLGLLGFLHLQDVYTSDIAPHLRDHLSPAALSIVNDTVGNVLGGAQVFWVTAGALLAVWQVSGAVRAVMGAFNTIYGVEEDRPLLQRLKVSILLAVATGAWALTAISAVTLTPLLYGDGGAALDVLLFLVRWVIAASLLLVGVGLLIHYAPATRPTIGWVSLGSLLVIGAWIAMSLGFGVYLRVIADYGSAFGNLATFVVLIAYLYLSCIAFLGGAQADAMIREEAEGTGSLG